MSVNDVYAVYAVRLLTRVGWGPDGSSASGFWPRTNRFALMPSRQGQRPLSSESVPSTIGTNEQRPPAASIEGEPRGVRELDGCRTIRTRGGSGRAGRRELRWLGSRLSEVQRAWQLWHRLHANHLAENGDLAGAAEARPEPSALNHRRQRERTRSVEAPRLRASSSAWAVAAGQPASPGLVLLKNRTPFRASRLKGPRAANDGGNISRGSIPARTFRSSYRRRFGGGVITSKIVGFPPTIR